MMPGPGNWEGRSLPGAGFRGTRGPFGAYYGVIQAAQRGVAGMRSATEPVTAVAVVRLRPPARRSSWGEVRIETP